MPNLTLCSPRRAFFAVTLAVLIALAMLAGWPALAQGNEPTATPDPGRAAVVIQAQGKAETYCVDLPESGATGLQALQATGRDLNVMAGPLGAAVCRLENLGCTYPAEHCFCQCQGATCRYWAYFFQNDSGAWQYSGMGMAGRPLKDGAVEGWLWTDGSSQTPTGSLPAVTFEAICGADAAASDGATPRADADSVAASGPSGLDRAGWIIFAALVVGVGSFLWWKRTGRRSGRAR
ncbi:MAG: hypothetical protein IT323_16335 [Anaerolineae bacterium]|nr:hypothetical protein [Anaerolineae bacterium]